MSDPASITLLPCPFCGEEPNITERPNAAYESTRFSCFISCMCGGYSACAHKFAIGDTPEETRSKAIAKWNTRPALAQPARAPTGVTPAMQLAGATVLYGRRDQYRLPEELAEAIYRAMAAVQPARAQAGVAELVALRDALAEVMEWISNWNPNFIHDDEWSATKTRAEVALKACADALAALGGEDG